MIKRTSLEHINSILKQNTNWNILDIGCGYTAHPKATIICDVQNLADYYPDQKFIQLARSVYITNDKRSAIKLEINNKFGSAIVEVKSYSKY